MQPESSSAPDVAPARCEDDRREWFALRAATLTRGQIPATKWIVSEFRRRMLPFSYAHSQGPETTRRRMDYLSRACVKLRRQLGVRRRPPVGIVLRARGAGRPAGRRTVRSSARSGSSGGDPDLADSSEPASPSRTGWRSNARVAS